MGGNRLSKKYPKRLKTGGGGFVRSGYYGRFAGVKRRGAKVEMKFFDTVNAGSAMATAGTIINPSINLVKQGNKENEMIGKSITVRSIMYRFELVLPGDSDGTMAGNISSDIYRVILVQDKQCNGAAATIALLLEQANVYGFNNLENDKRFKILKEWKGQLTAPGVNWDGTNWVSPQTIRYFKLYRKCYIPIEMAPEASAGTRAITEIKSNNIFLCGLTALGAITFLGNCRIRYTDS